jgi:hypothetical protein
MYLQIKQNGETFDDGFEICTVTGHESLQTFVILPKEETTVWVKQNVNFFQQNGSVIKIEQN